MKKTIVMCLVLFPFAAPALADTEASASAKTETMPMATTGPMSRMPKTEREDRKQLDAFFKAWNEAWKSGNADAVAAMVDFPVLMLSDTTDGAFARTEMTQEQWVGLMKPMMPTAGEKKPEHVEEMLSRLWSRRSTCYLLSDDLASCESETSVSGGKMKGTFHRDTIMTRTAGGAWKVKGMVESGWGNPLPASASNGAAPMN